MSLWNVHIVEKGTERIEKTLGPMDGRKADRVADGLRINLDKKRFYVKQEVVRAKK